MPNTSSQDLRLRVSQHKLKQKLLPEADELLGQILGLEDDRMKTDILRSLLGDSLNRFFDAQAPSFSHFAIRNAFGVAPAPQVVANPVNVSGGSPGNPVTEAQAALEGQGKKAEVVERESVAPAPESGGSANPVDEGQAVKSVEKRKSGQVEVEVEAEDEGVDEDWKPNPQFASFIQ